MRRLLVLSCLWLVACATPAPTPEPSPEVVKTTPREEAPVREEPEAPVEATAPKAEAPVAEAAPVAKAAPRKPAPPKPAHIEQAEQVLAATPASAHDWFNQGFAQELLARPKEARAAYERALKARPEHLPAVFNLAMLAHETSAPDAPALAKRARKLLSRKALAKTERGAFHELLLSRLDAATISKKAARKRLARLLKRSRKNVAWQAIELEASLLYQALGGRGQSHPQLELRQVLENGRPHPRSQRISELLARAWYHAAVEATEDLSMTRVLKGADQQELVREVKRMMALTTEGHRYARKVLGARRPRWTIRALLLIASQYEHVSMLIGTSPCPPELQAQQCDTYQRLLGERAEAISKEGAEFRQKALDYTAKERIYMSSGPHGDATPAIFFGEGRFPFYPAAAQKTHGDLGPMSLARPLAMGLERR